MSKTQSLYDALKEVDGYIYPNELSDSQERALRQIGFALEDFSNAYTDLN